MKKGKFIVIEGIDGCGKSTQVQLLANRLINNGIPLHVTKECSDGPIGQLLRSTYLSGNRKCDERVLNHLFAADRLDHITNEKDGMLGYINNGINVLCDRYMLSSLAYDTYMHIDTDQYDEALYDIITRNRLHMDLLTPDLTIVVDTPVSIALERLNLDRDNLSIYEKKESLIKIRKSYANAIEVLRTDFDNVIAVINGTRSIEEIANQIYQLVMETL